MTAANYQMSHDWHVPAKFSQAPGGGVFFFVSALARRFMTPNGRMERLISRVKRRIGWWGGDGAGGGGGGVIGVHVRHGDSCPKWDDEHSHLPGAKCEAFEKYLEAMEVMRDLYNASRALICTDDPGIISQLGQHKGWQFMHVPFARELFSESDWAIELRLVMATIDRRLVAETTLLDILLLSHADYFVGTLSSHFGALAYELSYATKGYHAPYVSLDYPWAGSLLAPVQHYGVDGETVDKVELNSRRRDFGERVETPIRRPYNAGAGG